MEIARGLLASVVPVIALHAAVFGLVSTAPVGEAVSSRSMPVRVEMLRPGDVPAETVPAMTPPSGAAAGAPADPARAERVRRPLEPASAPQQPAAAADAAPESSAPAVTPEAANAASPTSLDYLPRDRLSVPPRPIGFVDVPFPPEVTQAVHLAVQLTLFIDEQGTVQRVRIDGPDVGPVLEEAARSSFMQARFAPGELNGRAVRSQLRIEVTFESTAPPADPASR